MHTHVVRDDLSDLAKCVDECGSLVTVDPVDWIVCFVPGLQRQWWHRLVRHKHKHVFAMRPVSVGKWLLVEPWWTRLMITILSPADAIRFLRWGATGDMLKVRESVPGKASQMRGWSNCAVLTAFLLGRTSWAWTPNGLYRELLRDEATRRVNAEQLLVDQFATVASQHLSDAVTMGADRLSAPQLLHNRKESSSAFASLRSAVAKPSVKRRYTGASTSWPNVRRPSRR